MKISTEIGSATKLIGEEKAECFEAIKNLAASAKKLAEMFET